MTDPAGHPPQEHPHDRPRAEPPDRSRGQARRLGDNAIDGIQRGTVHYATTRFWEWFIDKLPDLL
ncbi:hypothetical protein ATM97_02945 [Nocardia sp. MH4]|uniref:hypothetical protein n=1 Tax=Nocardia sp. MH4 TaxID=1768677 RepID=UPI001C4FE60C|nr:hypothetical protein [Nocardia sp. MH4]MBW0270078.1 hypothetical protein [Nocardia sp. MH4]